MMGDGEVRPKLPKPIVVELSSVVRDENLRNFKFADDAFPYEIPCVLVGDLGKRLCLYPLSEVIDCNDQELSLQRSLRQ